MSVDEKKLMKCFIKAQMRLSDIFDLILPFDRRIRGNADFIASFVPRFLQRGLHVADVGGGRFPLITPAQKRSLAISVTGIDLSAEALMSAPDGCYDHIITADITRYSGKENFDLVICQSLLEHVKSAADAIHGLASLVRPDGCLLIFTPCRNAIYARLNLLLPQNFKKWLLYNIFTDTETRQGHPGFYDSCTPNQLKLGANKAGFELLEWRLYYRSSYFSFWLPLHAFWRICQQILLQLDPEEYAESFAIAFKRGNRYR